MIRTTCSPASSLVSKRCHRVAVVHVHGPQAQVEAFFELLETAIEEAEAIAQMNWPMLAFLDTLEDDES